MLTIFDCQPSALNVPALVVTNPEKLSVILGAGKITVQQSGWNPSSLRLWFFKPENSDDLNSTLGALRHWSQYAFSHKTEKLHLAGFVVEVATHPAVG